MSVWQMSEKKSWQMSQKYLGRCHKIWGGKCPDGNCLTIILNTLTYIHLVRDLLPDAVGKAIVKTFFARLSIKVQFLVLCKHDVYKVRVAKWSMVLAT